MKYAASNIDVKKLNRNRVFRYVISRERTSMPDIAMALGISVPTVLQIIRKLQEAQIIQEVGEFQSTGGRKAKAIAPVQNVCYAVGIDITRNHVSMVSTNLSEKLLKHERIRKPFIYEDTYFQQITEMLEEFIQKNQIPKEKIKGVGISIPGIVDRKKNDISYSHALNLNDINFKGYLNYIPYQTAILNDANAAAMTECVGGGLSGNMTYLFLSNTVGGAIFAQQEMSKMEYSNLNNYDNWSGNIYMGNHWRSGEFGHMVIRPEGNTCYCGKKGCLDAYCSALRLSDLANGSLEQFFKGLEKGNRQYEKVWEEYLDNLAIAVDNLQMCFDSDIVLGGYVGGYMKPYIQKFQKKVAEKNIFGNTGEYVRPCRYLVEAAALGAAIYQIEQYIDSI
ncbi:ROK family transcriptional regulator [Lachnospiraceae bacterium ZAX-1]